MAKMFEKGGPGGPGRTPKKPTGIQVEFTDGDSLVDKMEKVITAVVEADGDTKDKLGAIRSGLVLSKLKGPDANQQTVSPALIALLGPMMDTLVDDDVGAVPVVQDLSKKDRRFWLMRSKKSEAYPLGEMALFGSTPPLPMSKWPPELKGWFDDAMDILQGDSETLKLY